MRQRLTDAGIDDIEYIEILGASQLQPVKPVAGRVLLAVAVRVGATRLIDNIVLDVTDDDVQEAML